MAKNCDNTSVAVIVKDNEGRVLLIERKEYNPGWALPAGHQDGDDAEKAAKKELLEEVGLTVTYLKLHLFITLKNPCKREGGSFHRWSVFIAERWHGEVKENEREVKSFLWADKKKIFELAHKLESFMEKNKLSIDNLSDLVKTTNESESWKANLGLEPPMYVIFKELKII